MDGEIEIWDAAKGFHIVGGIMALLVCAAIFINGWAKSNWVASGVSVTGIIFVYRLIVRRLHSKYALKTTPQGLQVSGVREIIPWDKIIRFGYLEYAKPLWHPLGGNYKWYEAITITVHNFGRRKWFGTGYDGEVLKVIPNATAIVDVKELLHKLETRWQRALAEAGQEKAPRPESVDAGNGAK